MEPLSYPLPEIEHLDRITHVIATVSNTVRVRNLSAFQEPHWMLEIDEVPGRIGDWLHKLYGGRGFLRIFWLFLVLLILPLVISIESSYAALLAVWGSGGAASPLNEMRIVMTLLVAIITPLILAIAVGAYWSLYEIVVNRHLSWPLKALAVGLALMLAMLCCWFGFSFPTGISLNNLAVDQIIIETRQFVGYRIVTAIFVYVPPAILLARWGLQGLTALGIGFLSVVRWVGRFHRLESTDALRQFLSEPLSLKTAGASSTLLELDRREIQALRDWATCRREVIQSRLLPTTLLLGVLGILVDIPQVGRYLGSIIERAQALGSAMDLWSLLGSSFVFAIAILLFFGLSKLLIDLLDEAFVTDYIAQACVLAQHVKIAEEEQRQLQTTSASQTDRPLGFVDCLMRWLLSKKDQS